MAFECCSCFETLLGFLGFCVVSKSFFLAFVLHIGRIVFILFFFTSMMYTSKFEFQV